MRRAHGQRDTTSTTSLPLNQAQKTMAATPKSSAKTLASAVETKSRLEMCWNVDVKWNLYPESISKVN